jgi:hypothetical protein
MSSPQKKRQLTRAMQGQPDMTRKEALVVLYRLERAYNRTAIQLDVSQQTSIMGTPEQKAFRQQVRQALQIFAFAVHGPRPTGSLGLCERCYLRYATLVAWYHDANHLENSHCCSTCHQELQQRYTFLTEEQVDKELGL